MKIVGLSFDHMHMASLLGQAHDCPGVEIVGIADANPQNAANVQSTAEKLGIAQDRIYTDYRQCLEATRPDIAILCPAIAAHAELTELVASYGVHVLVEKPFAISLAHADRMIAATEKAGVKLAINWPIAWYPPHNTAYDLIQQGTIGEVIEVHSYGGNRGPTHPRRETTPEEIHQRKIESWFYDKAAGGGSLIDYIGYGVTLGSWFFGGKAPIEVTAAWDIPNGLQVDEHAIAIARYDTGLSKFETRWGTFTDPWVTQPLPKSGFFIVGTGGTIAIYDYEPNIQVQTTEHPEIYAVPIVPLEAPKTNSIEHFVDVIQNGTALHGPLDPQICRVGQRIVDAAIKSCQEKRTVSLAE